MDWLKDFFTPVTTTGIWSLVVYFLGRKIVKEFEVSINRTFDRLKKAGPAEFDPVPRSQSEATVEIDQAGSSVAIAAAVPDSLPARYEAKVTTELARANPPDREAYLVRMLAIAQIAWVFEANNFGILGSQIQFLQTLNTGPVPVSKVREFYDQAAIDFPDYYKIYPFEGWLNWLVSTAHFADQQDEMLSITEDGREFLRYLISRGYSFSRFG